jgi:oxygen-independent coproporphyrinogen-3 oxidase
VLDLACGLVDNVSADLIVAAPAGSRQSLDATLDAILGWPIAHVSAYLLEFHAATRFGRDLVAGRIVPTPDEQQARTYAHLVERLGTAGLEAYELSNFARPGREAVHNQRYWTRDPYLGIGPSAHSNVGAWRWAEQRDTATWVQGVEAGEARLEDLEQLGEHEMAEERILLGLRRREGIDETVLAGRTRLVDEYVRAGLLTRSAGKVAATTEGWLLLDQIVARLTD